MYPAKTASKRKANRQIDCFPRRHGKKILQADADSVRDHAITSPDASSTNKVYTLFQNGYHHGILLFACKLAFVLRLHILLNF